MTLFGEGKRNKEICKYEKKFIRGGMEGWTDVPKEEGQRSFIEMPKVINITCERKGRTWATMADIRFTISVCKNNISKKQQKNIHIYMYSYIYIEI